MADTREQILARLLTVVAGIPGVETAARNLDDLDEAALPAIVLHDGDEDAAENPAAIGLASNVVVMTPSILILVNYVPENVGTTASAWRAKVQKSVLGDTTLRTLCGRVSAAGVRYTGMTFTTFAGRDSKAELILTFAISYLFNPRAF